MTGAGPDFLILGAMKAGTSSLFSYIGQHPQMLMPSSKEIHYYDRYRYRGWSLDDYLAEFPDKPDGFITGEATPFYLRHPHAPKWVLEDFPDVKLIVILRDPVDRAYSHYSQRFQKGKETADFLSLIEKEDDLTADEWEKARKDPSYEMGVVQAYSFLSRGRYAEQLSNWTQSFLEDRFLILFAEELLAEPDVQMAKVFGHLGLPHVPVDTSNLKNKRSYPPIGDEARRWLEDYFARHNAALADKLGRDLPW